MCRLFQPHRSFDSTAVPRSPMFEPLFGTEPLRHCISSQMTAVLGSRLRHAILLFHQHEPSWQSLEWPRRLEAAVARTQGWPEKTSAVRRILPVYIFNWCLMASVPAPHTTGLVAALAWVSMPLDRARARASDILHSTRGAVSHGARALHIFVWRRGQGNARCNYPATASRSEAGMLGRCVPRSADRYFGVRRDAAWLRDH